VKQVPLHCARHVAVGDVKPRRSTDRASLVGVAEVLRTVRRVVPLVLDHVLVDADVALAFEGARDRDDARGP